jgi:hypothetical protein
MKKSSGSGDRRRLISASLADGGGASPACKQVNPIQIKKRLSQERNLPKTSTRKTRKIPGPRSPQMKSFQRGTLKLISPGRKGGEAGRSRGAQWSCELARGGEYESPSTGHWATTGLLSPLVWPLWQKDKYGCGAVRRGAARKMKRVVRCSWKNVYEIGVRTIAMACVWAE